uniref:hypothetical protein n=1 Tax=Ndongobacter massiliensis TaxID=1871025 RepID=UPI00093117FD|nr:hypothetical protein [Ndongobacter massiliensis]
MERTFQLYLYETREFCEVLISAETRTHFRASLQVLDGACRLWGMTIAVQEEAFGWQLQIVTQGMPKRRVLGSYYAHRICTMANALGLGARLAENPEAWSVQVGVPKRPPRLGETALAKQVQGIRFSDYVFLRNLSCPAREADLEKIGFGNLFYALKFSLPKTLGFPWRLILQRDTIEFHRFGNSMETAYCEAGALMAAFSQLMEQEGRAFTWRVTPQQGEHHFYACMALLETYFPEWELA